jgi:hypothetical protein
VAQSRFCDSFSYFELEKFPNLSHENPYPEIVLQKPELFFLVVWANIHKIRSGGGGGGGVSCVVVWDDRIGSVFLFSWEFQSACMGEGESGAAEAGEEMVGSSALAFEI